jgi:hypothetical protein
VIKSTCAPDTPSTTCEQAWSGTHWAKAGTARVSSTAAAATAAWETTSCHIQVEPQLGFIDVELSHNTRCARQRRPAPCRALARRARQSGAPLHVTETVSNSVKCRAYHSATAATGQRASRPAFLAPCLAASEDLILLYTGAFVRCASRTCQACTHVQWDRTCCGPILAAAERQAAASVILLRGGACNVRQTRPGGCLLEAAPCSSGNTNQSQPKNT